MSDKIEVFETDDLIRVTTEHAALPVDGRTMRVVEGNRPDRTGVTARYLSPREGTQWGPGTPLSVNTRYAERV